MNKTQGVAIAGLGAIGAPVARALLAGAIDGLHLAAVSARDEEKARRNLGEPGAEVPILPLKDLASSAETIVEALPAASFLELARAAVEQGRRLLVLSAGCLLDQDDLIARARETGARIVVPSGAMLGLDAIRAAAERDIESVTIVTRKPPSGLAGAPLLVEQGIDVTALREPLCVFAGTVREAVKHFPANVNVAAAVSLAGIGPDRTAIEVWADPALKRNTHLVTVRSASANFSMSIEGLPSPENPRTGLMTPQSTIAALRRLTEPLVIGT